MSIVGFGVAVAGLQGWYGVSAVGMGWLLLNEEEYIGIHEWPGWVQGIGKHSISMMEFGVAPARWGRLPEGA